jgi:hypothetical protein
MEPANDEAGEPLVEVGPDTGTDGTAEDSSAILH